MRLGQIVQLVKLYQSVIWLLFAISITAATFIVPTAALPKQVIDVVFIVDITQSMNARDVEKNGISISRLDAAKQAIQSTLKHLPCGSTVGIGIFAAKDTLLMFNPIELCEHYSLLNKVVSRLSWRMAWAGDSNIQRGLYSAIGQVAELEGKPGVVFFTDGEQTVSEQYPAPLQKRAGKVNGLIVGVGGSQPVRIPKYSDDNQLIGYWKAKDVGHKNPLHKKDINDEDYLSQMDEGRLREYASITKLDMRRLEHEQQLVDRLLNSDLTRTRTGVSDIRWIFATVALMMLLFPYFVVLLQNRSVWSGWRFWRKIRAI